MDEGDVKPDICDWPPLSLFHLGSSLIPILERARCGVGDGAINCCSNCGDDWTSFGDGDDANDDDLDDEALFVDLGDEDLEDGDDDNDEDKWDFIAAVTVATVAIDETELDEWQFNEDDCLTRLLELFDSIVDTFDGRLLLIARSPFLFVIQPNVLK